MPKKKEDIATEDDVVAKTAEIKATPAYELAERYKKYSGILVGGRLVKAQDGKVIADDELHKVLMEGGFLA